MTGEDSPESELMPERIRPGDLKALRVLDRYDASVFQREQDLADAHYGQPLFYDLHPRWGGMMRVHHSRVLRFDGLEPGTDSRWVLYEQDWGVSLIVPAVLSLMQDQAFASHVAHLGAEASIPVLGIDNLRAAASGKPEPGEPTVEQIGEDMNRLKSIYRLMMVEKGTEEFSRVAVQFGGLADLSWTASPSGCRPPSTFPRRGSGGRARSG